MTDTRSHDCDGCPLVDEGAMKRRDFVREAVAVSLGAIGALAGLADPLPAMPVTFVSGSGARAARAYPIPAADGVAIDREESVIIARSGQRVFAFSLACPHQNTALRWEAKNNRFQCPKHKSRYQPDGVFIEGRATRGLDRFAVQRDAAQVLVDLDALYRQDKHPAEWAAAFIDLSAK